jgi:hypothetical protein
VAKLDIGSHRASQLGCRVEMYLDRIRTDTNLDVTIYHILIQIQIQI